MMIKFTKGPFANYFKATSKNDSSNIIDSSTHEGIQSASAYPLLSSLFIFFTIAQVNVHNNPLQKGIFPVSALTKYTKYPLSTYTLSISQYPNLISI